MRLFKCKNCQKEKEKEDDIKVSLCGCGEYMLDITNDRIIKVKEGEIQNE